MTQISERLAVLKKKLAAGRLENLKAVQQEREQQKETAAHEKASYVSANGLDGTAGQVEKREAQKRERAKKRRYDELSAADLVHVDEADGENDDERVRGMKRRAKASAHVLSRQMDHNGTRAMHPEGDAGGPGDGSNVLVYGGAGTVEKEALDNMVEELEVVEKRRAKFRRRRAFDEENSDITFINEGNRLFNRTLERHFDKFDSVKELKDNLERGTA